MILKSLRETRKFLKKFTKEIIDILKKKKNLIVIFSGHLGAGKTTFIKEIAKNLNIKANIKSPSFVLWQIYPFYINKFKFYLHHIDLYRIPYQDILKLSLKKRIKEKNNLFLIEWGEKLEDYLKRRKLKYIKISIKKENRLRYLSIKDYEEKNFNR